MRIADVASLFRRGRCERMVACCCRRVWHDQETRVKGIRRKIPDVRGYAFVFIVPRLCQRGVGVTWSSVGGQLVGRSKFG